LLILALRDYFRIAREWPEPMPAKKPFSNYGRLDHTKPAKFENRSASKIPATVCIRYAPVIGFELRCAGAPIETRPCWEGTAGTHPPIQLGREKYSPGIIRRSAPVQINPRLPNVQRDDFSLFTSKFESDMLSHAVGLPNVSRRDASRAMHHGPWAGTAARPTVALRSRRRQAPRARAPGTAQEARAAA
jgi:hypothetical protein